MSFLFGQPKLTKNDLCDCLDWLGKQYQLAFFQDHEAELYNNALLVDLNSITASPESAKKVVDAANRLVQASESLVYKHANIRSVPEAAASNHYSWGLVYLRYKAWAVASRAALEAVLKGSSFNQDYVQKQLQDYNNSSQKAENEQKNLIKLMSRSGATMADFQKLTNEASQEPKTNDRL